MNCAWQESLHLQGEPVLEEDVIILHSFLKEAEDLPGSRGEFR